MAGSKNFLPTDGTLSKLVSISRIVGLIEIIKNVMVFFGL